MPQIPFFFHYSKSAAEIAKRPKLVINYENSQKIVDFVKVFVYLESTNRDEEPRCVLKGVAEEIRFEEDCQGLRTVIIK